MPARSNLPEPNVLDSFRLDGKVALVTGAGGGIGWAYAEALSDVGAAVACVDVDALTAENVASALRGHGRSAIGIRADVTSELDIRDAFDRAEEELGPVQIVFANAGIGGETAPLTETTLDGWNAAIGVDLTGVFLTMREAARRMEPRGYGKIISTSSIFGLAGEGRVGAFAYTAAKAGVVNLTRSAALSLAAKGIRVNSIAPTFTRTSLGDGRLAAEDDDALAYQARLAKGIPLGRLAEPDDLKGIAVFLASPASDYCTGATYPVDGGWLAG